uniref:hypothetical protein n=1 Tax=Aeribacillus sp. FSL W8-0870 TaxID=2954706 RepID=UPI00403F64B4
MISEKNREAIVNTQTKTKPLTHLKVDFNLVCFVRTYTNKDKASYPFKGRRGFLFFFPLFSFPHVQSLLARLF